MEFDIKKYFKDQYATGASLDPIIDIVLSSINLQFEELQNQYLIDVYPHKKLKNFDAYYELLRRNLLGALFPGPVYSVAEANSKPGAGSIKLDSSAHFRYQTESAALVTFSPCKEVLIVPAASNEIIVKESKGDLFLGINAKIESEEPKLGNLLIYFRDENIGLLQKLKSYSWQVVNAEGNPEEIKIYDSGINHRFDDNTFPLQVQIYEEFINSPFDSSFLMLPIECFAGREKSKIFDDEDSLLWLKINDLGDLADKFTGNLFINCFPVWNMISFQDEDAKFIGGSSYHLNLKDTSNSEIFIRSVKDYSGDEFIEYFDEKTILDPAYPYQYSFLREFKKQEATVRLSKKAKGTLKVVFDKYDYSDEFNELIPKTLEISGLQEVVTSVSLIKPTQRMRIVTDSSMIWDYFRSNLNGRRKWVTKNEVKDAVKKFPAIALYPQIKPDDIYFKKRVGRIDGLLTPYTDIIIPYSEFLPPEEESKLIELLTDYLQSRSTLGNFIIIHFEKAED